MDHLRKALTQCKYHKWALYEVDKRQNRPSREVTDGTNNQGTTDTKPKPTTIEVKTKGHIVIPYTQGLCESIKICGGMAYRPTSKVVAPSRNYWSPPRTKNPWSAKVGPYTGSKVVTSTVMMTTQRKPPGLLEKDSKST